MRVVARAGQDCDIAGLTKAHQDIPHPRRRWKSMVLDHRPDPTFLQQCPQMLRPSTGGPHPTGDRVAVAANDGRLRRHL